MNIKALQPYLIFLLSSFLFASLTYANENNSGIEVAGTAKLHVTPDIARFSFSIHYRGTVLSDVKQKVDKHTSGLIKRAKKLAIKQNDINSSTITIYPQYNHKTQSLIGYDVSRTVKITLKDLSKYSELVNSAIALHLN